MSRIIDETGNQYGYLTVIKNLGLLPLPNCNRNITTYECKCNCGKIFTVSANNLKSKNGTTSCGCIKSNGELTAYNLLLKNNIEFKEQYSFDDLIGDYNKLKFDFAIFKNGKLYSLLEVDGDQHSNKNNRFYNEKICEYDIKKNDYCLKNNIKLVRIKSENYKNFKLTDLF